MAKRRGNVGRQPESRLAQENHGNLASPAFISAACVYGKYLNVCKRQIKRGEEASHSFYRRIEVSVNSVIRTHTW